jgi:hypothetical protein
VELGPTPSPAPCPRHVRCLASAWMLTAPCPLPCFRVDAHRGCSSLARMAWVHPALQVLAERYQKLVAKTEMHEEANEIAMDVMLDNDFEVKKNGCERGFPFFIVPSLQDKKQDGNFQLLVYSDKPIVVQMLSDEDRKL